MARRASTYRREAEEVLADLQEPELRVAGDFLQFLRSKGSDLATVEILQSPSLLRDVRAAKADRAKGRTSQFTSWDTV